MLLPFPACAHNSTIPSFNFWGLYSGEWRLSTHNHMRQLHVPRELWSEFRRGGRHEPRKCGANIPRSISNSDCTGAPGTINALVAQASGYRGAIGLSPLACDSRTAAISDTAWSPLSLGERAVLAFRTGQGAVLRHMAEAMPSQFLDESNTAMLCRVCRRITLGPDGV